MFPSIRALLLSALLCFLNFSSIFAHQLHVTKGTDGAGNPQITLGIDPTEGFTYVPIPSRSSNTLERETHLESVFSV